MSGVVQESDFTSGRFSTLEAIAKKRADDGAGGLHKSLAGDGMVRVPPVDSIAEQEGVSRVKDRNYPSQSAKSLVKHIFQFNRPNYLDLSQPTTSFGADQMIQFARAVGLEGSLASYI